MFVKVPMKAPINVHIKDSIKVPRKVPRNFMSLERFLGPLIRLKGM